MNDIVPGVLMLIIGMAFLFLAMALLILVMVLLERIFRTRKLVPDQQEPGEIETVSRHARDTGDEEIVAAIALALTHLRSLELGRSGLGTTLEAGHGSWWTMGQVRQQPTNIVSAPKDAKLSETSSTPQGRS